MRDSSGQSKNWAKRQFTVSDNNDGARNSVVSRTNDKSVKSASSGVQEIASGRHKLKSKAGSMPDDYEDGDASQRLDVK